MLLHRSAESVFKVFGKKLHSLDCAMALVVSLATLCGITAKKRMLAFFYYTILFSNFYKIQYLNISEAEGKK